MHYLILVIYNLTDLSPDVVDSESTIFDTFGETYDGFVFLVVANRRTFKMTTVHITFFFIIKKAHGSGIKAGRLRWTYRNIINGNELLKRIIMPCGFVFLFSKFRSGAGNVCEYQRPEDFTALLECLVLHVR